MNQAGKNTHEHICESLELFAREVMPEFHARIPEQEDWKAKVLAREIELEEIDTAALPRPLRPEFGANHARRSGGVGHGVFTAKDTHKDHEGVFRRSRRNKQSWLSRFRCARSEQYRLALRDRIDAACVVLCAREAVAPFATQRNASELIDARTVARPLPRRRAGTAAADARCRARGRAARLFGHLCAEHLRQHGAMHGAGAGHRAHHVRHRDRADLCPHGRGFRAERRLYPRSLGRPVPLRHRRRARARAISAWA